MPEDNSLDEEVDFALQMQSLAQQASHLREEAALEGPEAEEALPGDHFAIQMESLAKAASHRPAEEATPGAPSAPEPPVPLGPTLAEILKPLIVGIEALSHVTADHSQALQRLETFISGQVGLPAVLASLEENLNHKNRLNQKQFDALHEELRTYKDGFLLELLHKPIVRDLITLFDDLAAVHRRAVGLAAEPNRSVSAHQIDNLSINLDHVMHFLLEILARLEVQRLEASTGKLDKQRQRAISVEWVATEEEDQTIVQSVKPGFLWRERLLRPEEVVIRKWKENAAAAAAPARR